VATLIKPIQVSLLLTIVLLTLFPFHLQFAAGQSANDNSGITQTQTALSSAFASVKAAEAEGADVSTLTTILNEAGQLLTQAQLAYLAKDYNSAASLASASRSKINGISDLANNLKGEAVRSRGTSLVITVLLTLFSLTIFSVGVAAWMLLGRKTQRRETVESTPV
jgi:hypothetical protein